ncbi:M20 aminoacylase family protein [Mesorhizobium sp. LNJC394B00]|uniref:M20 aminoacylase family protein n=1 Tax=Mesorhizobium sp. LNJC394B00 TaxID=1287274 RepID=UPI0003CE3E3B|nr:M20 aminoacylase family protein [Mesorhizobium sp. LNJC394B00]ESY15376.1 N-acyl-L-amino acid amidohydrolase [Mesorhizobium sp. LNJC394B00]
MRGVEAFKELTEEVAEWRHYLHEHPELEYALYNTATFVAEKLASFGINHIETGIAETGIVALIQGELGDGPTIGLRADMDALPIMEASNKPWSSKVPGKMHGCGHDGHTAMLLGAAKYLANTRNFKGTVALIFQPAEEDGRGGEKMVQEGIMERFGVSRVFGMHNYPGLEVGKFMICSGPIQGGLDDFDLIVKGKGGHASTPHHNIDPIVIGAQIIVGLQALVSRCVDPREAFVISVTKMHAGDAYNIIPQNAEISGTVRYIEPHLPKFAEKAILQVAQGIARGFGADVDFDYRRLEPITVNHEAETRLAVEAARGLVGAKAVDDRMKPGMGAEDFAYMLQARPGAYIFLGNGATASVHNPAYDFDDDALPYGIGYWVNLVEGALAA